MTNKFTPKKTTVKKGIVIGVVLGIVLFVFIFSFNMIVSNSLKKYFETTLVADVYELGFKNLRVNLFTGNIKVRDVTLQPRPEPRKNYPYINSSVNLTTSLLLLEHVDLMTLLFDKQLVVDKITIDKPNLNFDLNGRRNIFLPFPEKSKQESDSIPGEEKIT